MIRIAALALSLLVLSACEPDGPPAGDKGGAAAPAAGKAAPLVADKTHHVAICTRSGVALRWQRGTPGQPNTLYLSEKPLFLARPLRSLVVYVDTSAIDYIGPPPSKLGVEATPLKPAQWVEGKELQLLSAAYRKGKTLKRVAIKPAALLAAGLTRPSLARVQAAVRVDVIVPYKPDPRFEDAPHQLAPDARPPKTMVDVSLVLFRTADRLYVMGWRRGWGTLPVQLQLESAGPSKPSVDIDDPAHKTFRW